MRPKHFIPCEVCGEWPEYWKHLSALEANSTDVHKYVAVRRHQSERCRHCGYTQVDHGNNGRCPLVLADGVRVGFSNLYRYTPKK